MRYAARLKPNIGIWVEVSGKTGYGNIIRCKNLGECFREKGHKVSLICNKAAQKNNLIEKHNGIKIIYYPQGLKDSNLKKHISEIIKKNSIEVLIADIFTQYTKKSHKSLSAIKAKNVFKVALYDDSKQRRITSDLLINPSPAAKGNDSGLFGIKYFIANYEFLRLRNSFIVRNNVKRVFVSFGGVDPAGITIKILKALEQIKQKFEINIPVTPYTNKINQIKKFRAYSKNKINLMEKKQNSELAKIMAKSDVAFCAGGNTLAELCILGVPSMTLSPIRRLDEICRKFKKNGACLHIGYNRSITQKMIERTFMSISNDNRLRNRLSKKAKSYVDGGGGGRIYRAIMSRWANRYRMKVAYFGHNEVYLKKIAAISDVRLIVVSPAINKIKLKEIKNIAEENNILLLIKKDIKSKSFLKQIQSTGVDIIISGEYPKKIPRTIFDHPPLKAINIHKSLLPKYRSAHPLNWAIVNNEKSAGITIHYISNEIDAGDIITQKRIPICLKDSITDIRDRLEKEGSIMIERVLSELGEENVKPLKQNHSDATYYPPRKPHNSRINWGANSLQIYNLIRASVKPYAAYTRYKNKVIEVYKSEIIKSQNKIHRPGEIMNNIGGITIATGGGFIRIKKIKVKGQKIKFIKGELLE